jgi:hypothetical protein
MRTMAGDERWPLPIRLLSDEIRRENTRWHRVVARADNGLPACLDREEIVAALPVQVDQPWIVEAAINIRASEFAHVAAAELVNPDLAIIHVPIIADDAGPNQRT